MSSKISVEILKNVTFWAKPTDLQVPAAHSDDGSFWNVVATLDLKLLNFSPHNPPHVISTSHLNGLSYSAKYTYNVISPNGLQGESLADGDDPNPDSYAPFKPHCYLTMQN